MDPLDGARRYFAGREDVFLVGGRLRDALLGWVKLDTDIVVPEDALGHARAIADAMHGSFVVLDEERDVGRVVWALEPGHAWLDIARRIGPTLEADLRVRDFTVNAMAVPLDAGMPPSSAAIIDPTDGLADLVARVMRMTSPAAFEEDPLRMLRGPRLAAQLGFTIHPTTYEAIRSRAGLIQETAAERIREELLGTLGAAEAARWTVELDGLGLLDRVLPELTACHSVTQPLPHNEDVFDHSVSVLAAVERLQQLLREPDAVTELPDAWRELLVPFRERLLAHLWQDDLAGHSRATLLRLATLVHDIGKPATRSVDPATGRFRFLGHEQTGANMARSLGRRLRLSARAVGYLDTVVRHHLRPLHLARAGRPTHRAVYRYFRATGDAGVDIALLALADNDAKGQAEPERAQQVNGVVERLLQAWFDEHARRVAPAPLLSGRELIDELGIVPGPEVGRLLARLQEAQAAGEVTTRDRALKAVRNWHHNAPPAGVP
jgi:putative nucleotidyltransferase with HDIG domain